MSEQNHGGPAFPVHLRENESWAAPGSPDGMTLRDWFAGQALAGFLSNCDEGGMNGWLGSYSQAAIEAYEHADAMLEAREKGGAK